MKTSRIIAYPCCVPYVAEGEQRMIFKYTRPVAIVAIVLYGTTSVNGYKCLETIAIYIYDI